MTTDSSKKLHNLIPDEQWDTTKNILEEALKVEHVDNDPIVLRIAVGIASWFSSLFALGFLCAAFEPEESGAIAIGIILILTAGCIHHRAQTKVLFLEQSILCTITTGHLLVLFGAGELFGGDPMDYAMTQTALCTIGVFAYKSSIYRTVSLLLAIVLWTVTAIETEQSLIYHALLTVQVLALAGLALWRAKSSSYLIALGISLTGSILFLDWLHSDLWRERLEITVWPANICMTILLAYTAHKVIPKVFKNRLQGISIFIILALLAFASTPGVLLGTTLFLYGRGTYNRLLESLGICGLFASTVFYYYSLQVSLLAKSGSMILSGTLLLCVATYLLRKTPNSQSKDTL